ncbi:DUF2806 domain-containing protein [Cupriavidus basilensis]
MKNELEATSGDGDVGSALSVTGDAIVDLVTGIPTPIRKNATRAFTRLCTAAVEYPVTLIEGAIAEKRAESRARVKLIDASANQLAKQMHTDPEYIRAAATKFAHKIVRERVNIDQVSAIAATELKNQPIGLQGGEESKIPPISEDWLNSFESEAAQMSSEQMQHIFGKILAGEVRKPASFSIRTVKLVSQLDNRAASLFKLLCSLAISVRLPDSIVDARVVAMGKAGANSLQPYGLSFDALNALQEYGLIIADYDSYMDYQLATMHEGEVILPFDYQDGKWVFIPKTAPEAKQQFLVHGIRFSQAGKELLSIVEIEPHEEYTAALKAFFDLHGMAMTRFS